MHRLPQSTNNKRPHMKLATLKTGGRDGTLVVVSRDLKRYQ